MQLTTARALHILGSAFFAVLGVLGSLHVQIPGIQITESPTEAFAMAAALLGAGYSGPKAAAAILFALLVAGTPLPADAQGVPLVPKAVTAAQTHFCEPTQCTGFYVRGFVSESGGSLNIPSTGLQGLASNQLSTGIGGGYQFWNDKWFAAIEADFQYGLMQNGTVPGGGNSGLWGGGLLVKLGYNLLNATAPTGGPQLPNGMVPIAPYAILGDWIRPWGNGFASGAGIEGWLSKNWTVNVDYIHVNYNNAAINPLVNEQTEDMVLGGVQKFF